MQQQQQGPIHPVFITDREEIENSQKRWLKTEKGYKCNRCGYYSERRSNVDRHFTRIHCQLKKFKTCICEKKFATKGDYYEHCSKEHPNSRHSWLVTSKKYKMDWKTTSNRKNNHESQLDQEKLNKCINEYLSLIDFEMLDAILNLKYLKESKSYS